jgi:hypothetical protein
MVVTLEGEQVLVTLIDGTRLELHQLARAGVARRTTEPPAARAPQLQPAGDNAFERLARQPMPR